MSGHKYSSFKKYYDEIILQAIEECILCGECVRNCPMISLTPLKGKDPEDIMEKMINFLKDGTEIASVCPGCKESFYPHLRKYPGLVLKDIVTLVNEAMGGREYENKLAKYWIYGNIDKVIEESRDIFLEHGFTEDEMRKILPAFPPFTYLEEEYKGGFI